jgi:hypothetical protein
MKKILALALLSGLFLLANAQAPTFENGEFLYDGIVLIDVGLYSSPFAFDWNGDGKKDLITGQFDQGNIRYYENIGEHNDPVFFGFSFLQASSTTINLPYG